MITNLFPKKNRVRGFTLIELMVAVTIFAIVMVMGVGAILAIVNGNRKTQSLQVAMNNLNYAVENMTRLMKTGHGFHQHDSDCNDGNSDIFFTTTDDQDVNYSLSNGSLILTTPSNSGEAVTAPEIKITRLCFTVLSSVGKQPAVVMVIDGNTSGQPGTQSEFSLHTSVTQRAVQY